MSQLNSVEKYALRFLETQHDFEDLKQAEVIFGDNKPANQIVFDHIDINCSYKENHLL